MPEQTSPIVSPATNGNTVCHLISDKAPTPTGNGHFVCHVLSDKLASVTTAVLELRVRNHPGTMSHITGLFARRGFNLEAIICVPVGDGTTSCMLLLVADEPRLEQVERQLVKLYDVLSVRHRTDLTPEFFYRLTSITGGASSVPTA